MDRSRRRRRPTRPAPASADPPSQAGGGLRAGQAGPAAALLLLALAAAPPAAGQPADPPEAPPRTPPSWAAGLRAGLFDMTNSPDAYDAVFGDPMPRLGAQLELDALRRWRFALTLDYGTVDGERVLLTDPPRGTGVDEELTTLPLHLTAAWRFRPRAAWDAYLGAGPSLLDWEDESEGTSEGGTDTGGSVVLGLRRQRPSPPGVRRPGGWEWGGELRWSTFPGALPDEGAAGFFDEDDPGGLSLTFVALRRFGP